MSLLVIEGKPPKDELVDAWEKIVQENGKRNGDNQYDVYFTLLKGYAELMAQHTIVSALLLKLTYTIDWEAIHEVRKMGYVIDTATSASYAKSLDAAKRKASSIITKAERRRKEIERVYGKKEGEPRTPTTYEEIIGNLELALERTIMDAETLTLAKYNVLRKGIEQKRKSRENESRSHRSK